MDEFLFLLKMEGPKKVKSVDFENGRKNILSLAENNLFSNGKLAENYLCLKNNERYSKIKDWNDLETKKTKIEVNTNLLIGDLISSIKVMSDENKDLKKTIEIMKKQIDDLENNLVVVRNKIVNF